MTHTIELSPEVEEALEAEAKRRGVSTKNIVVEAIGHYVVVTKEKRAEIVGKYRSVDMSPRQRAAMRGHGMLASRERRVIDFLNERHEEAETEIAQAARRAAGDFS